MITGFDGVEPCKALSPARSNGQVPKSASLTIYVPHEDIQKAGLRKGLVIDNNDDFTTCLYKPGLQLPLCFHCNHWGHTQATRRAGQNCGFCAQGHNTREDFVNSKATSGLLNIS